MPFLCFLRPVIALLVATASEPPAKPAETPDAPANGPRLKLSQDSWNFGTHALAHLGSAGKRVLPRSANPRR